MHLLNSRTPESELVTSVSMESKGNSYAQGNELLRSLHEARMQRGKMRQVVSVPAPEVSKPVVFKVLSYNVWFNEEIALEARIKAIGSIIDIEKPDAIGFQEVTPRIFRLMALDTWWCDYRCSVSEDAVRRGPSYFSMLLVRNTRASTFETLPFPNSIMGRGLTYTIMTAIPLVLATTHLESPTPPLFYQQERKQQLMQSFDVLARLSGGSHGVIFVGDMNWSETRSGKIAGDGSIPFPSGDSFPWSDAWLTKHSGTRKPSHEIIVISDDETEEIPTKKQRTNSSNDALSLLGNIPAGYTYDNVANPMIKTTRKLQLRLDRCFYRPCVSVSLEVKDVALVGKEPIPNCTYAKHIRSVLTTLPVLPSDHYGLLTTFTVSH